HQYGSDNDDDDDNGPVQKPPAYTCRTPADEDYESDQPINVKVHDVRLDPFDDPETDGINPEALSDDTDLDDIEKHPARARDIVEEMAVELQVDDNEDNEDNEDSYVGNQLGDRTVVGSDAIPGYASDTDVNMDDDAGPDNNIGSEPSGSEWEQDKNQSDTSDDNMDAHEDEDDETAEAHSRNIGEEDVMDDDEASNHHPKPKRHYGKRAQARIEEEPQLDLPDPASEEDEDTEPYCLIPGPNDPLPVMPKVKRSGHRGASAPDVGLLQLTWSKHHNLRLLKLHPALRAAIRWAFKYIEGYIVSVDSYPDSQPSLKLEFIAHVLRAAVRETNAPKELRLAMERDEDFLSAVYTLPNVRLSQFRKHLKDTVEAKIDALYHLDPNNNDYERRLDALLNEKRYIFPGDPLKVRVNRGKAYDHPIFISVVRSFIFGARLYLFQVHAPLFREEYNGHVYKIIPFPFVAFIATAVFSCLRDRAIAAKPLDFSASSYKDSYRQHFLALQWLGKQKPRALLKLTKFIYAQAGMGVRVPEEDYDSDVVQYMDIDAMDDNLTEEDE
ncbi:hypothetical protein PHLGIDRAFT_123463, partial [Phlebiopsis gigantea 11061_1 CR5-6]